MAEATEKDSKRQGRKWDRRHSPSF